MDAFKDLPFVEFFEDEVQFSIEMKVPPGTEPGKKSIQCQMGYQICNDKFCYQPGHWTLPAVEFTVLSGGLAKSATPTTPAPSVAVAAPATSKIEMEPGVVKAKTPIAPMSDVEKSLQGGRACN